MTAFKLLDPSPVKDGNSKHETTYMQPPRHSRILELFSFIDIKCNIKLPVRQWFDVGGKSMWQVWC